MPLPLAPHSFPSYLFPMKDWLSPLLIAFFVALACVLLTASLTLRSHGKQDAIYRVDATHTTRDDATTEVPPLPVELMKVRTMTQLGWNEEQAASIKKVWADKGLDSRVHRLLAEGTDPTLTADLVNGMVGFYVAELIEQSPDTAVPVEILSLAKPATAPYNEEKPYDVVLNSAIAGLAAFKVSFLVLLRRQKSPTT